MTMTSTTPATSYTGNGVTTTFAVPFQFFGADELEVIERVIATGAETVKTLSTHYSVTGGDGSTGTVTAVTAPASTVEWHIRRKTLRTQATDYADGEALEAATLETDFDRLAALVQELERDINRAILLPKTEPAADLILPIADDRASMYLGFDENGDLIVTEGTSGPQGPTGPAGTDGADGADGSVWHTGASDPAGGTGVDGDYYFQTGTGATGVLGDVWRKSAGSWAIIGNIRGQAGATGATGTDGANGADGADGALWYDGSTDPAGGTGVDGDYYIQTGVGATGIIGDVWTKAGGTWSIIGNIRGATGATGPAGAGSGDMLAANNLSDVASVSTARTNLGLGALAVKATVATADIDANAVSDATFRQSAGLSVVGRSANSSGDVADIAAANDGEVLRRSGTTLGFGKVANAGLADMSEATVKGRAAGVGTGGPSDLTAAQLKTILSLAGSDIAFTPAGGIAATDVQAALEELDSEKLSLAGGTMSGALTMSMTGAQLMNLTQADDGAVQGPLVTLIRQSASPAAADRIGGVRFQGWNSTPVGGVNYVVQRGVIDDPTAGSEDSSLEWLTYVAGSSAARMTLGGGLWMAGATGGDKGAGTINAQAVYDDNTLLTCYVADVIDATSGAAGRIDDAAKAALIAKWDAKAPDRVVPGGEDAEGKKLSDQVVTRQHFGARKFLARLGTEYDPRTIEGAMKHLQDKGHLTSLPNPAKWVQGSMSTGDWIQRLTEAVELCAVWAWQERQARLALEARVAALEAGS